MRNIERSQLSQKGSSYVRKLGVLPLPICTTTPHYYHTTAVREGGSLPKKKTKKNWVCFYSNVMILTFQDSTDAVWWNSVVPVRQKILIQEFAEDPSGQPGVEPFLWPCQV